MRSGPMCSSSADKTAFIHSQCSLSLDCTSVIIEEGGHRSGLFDSLLYSAQLIKHDGRPDGAVLKTSSGRDSSSVTLQLLCQAVNQGDSCKEPDNLGVV